MSLTERELETVNYYDQTAEEWARNHPVSIWTIEMQKFKYFLRGGDVVEIGVGAGREAKALLDDGYNYVGVDPSAGVLKVAKRINPSGNFVNASVFDLGNLNQKFDGFWAAASLLHVPKVRINEALQKINGVTRKGGIGFVSMKEGVGEIEDETGRTFSYYSQAKFNKILDRNGFSVLEKTKREEGSLTWLLYYVQKR